MKILKEANGDGAFNPFARKGWVNLITPDTEKDEALAENIELEEDKYTDLEVGTCFKVANNPAVYEIVDIDKNNMATFGSYGHPNHTHYRADVAYLQEQVDAGEFIILPQSEIDALHNY